MLTVSRWPVAGHRSGRLLGLQIGDNVAVPVEGDRNALLSEPLLHDLRADLPGQPGRGAGAPKFVKSKSRQARPPSLEAGRRDAPLRGPAGLRPGGRRSSAVRRRPPGSTPRHSDCRWATWATPCRHRGLRHSRSAPFHHRQPQPDSLRESPSPSGPIGVAIGSVKTGQLHGLKAAPFRTARAITGTRARKVRRRDPRRTSPIVQGE